MIAARFVRDQELAVNGATKPLERIIEPGKRLQKLDGRATTDGRKRERVELLVRCNAEARELDTHVAKRAAVIGVVAGLAGRSAIWHYVVRGVDRTSALQIDG